MEQQSNDRRASTNKEIGSASPQLEDLIPLAVVVACGCEPCAESLVRRALQAGSSRRDVQKVLAIIQYMMTVDCLILRVGQEAVTRMAKPLAAAVKTLEEFQQPERTGCEDACC